VLRDAFGDTLRVIDPAEHAAPKFVEAVGAAYERGFAAGGGVIDVDSSQGEAVAATGGVGEPVAQSGS
jgi:hypothetical protein